MSAIVAGLTRLARDMPRCDAERFGIELYGAPRFSVFDVLDNREVTLSRVLADLFDPKGRHGQGSLFLRNLLRELSLPHHEQRIQATVRTEAPIAVKGRDSNRRIDILIEMKDCVIGIENKKWSGEGSDQLSDYISYIRTLAAGRSCCLLYISKRKPSIECADIIRVPYYPEANIPMSIDRVLKISRPQVKSEKIGAFVDDFSGWIGRTFGNLQLIEGLQGYMDTIIEALGDRQKAQAIGAAILSRQILHKHLITQVGGALTGKTVVDISRYSCGHSL